jgi:hypothetical protein
MSGVELMDRDDTKFIIDQATLLEVLEASQPFYRVLEVNGARCSSYQTVYYDTPDFFFYTRHHNGKLNRLKIRKRRYVQSNLNFLEVKFKTNREKTIKERTRLPDISEELNTAELNFIREECALEASLEPKIWNFFDRVALVSTEYGERITLDFRLSFRNDRGNRVMLPDLAVVEIKQPRRNRNSPMFAELHKRHIRPQSISKYCTGAAMLYPSLKRNAFKGRLRRIIEIGRPVNPES